mmetsp:Transcript_7314/g.13869  ORF Transcript_7314/g.13869 Transcript_7314/m.13869 type:complete len:235 (+) Transcript_7314:388-1092(+)
MPERPALPGPHSQVPLRPQGQEPRGVALDARVRRAGGPRLAGPLPPGGVALRGLGPGDQRLPRRLPAALGQVPTAGRSGAVQGAGAHAVGGPACVQEGCLLLRARRPERAAPHQPRGAEHGRRRSSTCAADVPGASGRGDGGPPEGAGNVPGGRDERAEPSYGGGARGGAAEGTGTLKERVLLQEHGVRAGHRGLACHAPAQRVPRGRFAAAGAGAGVRGAMQFVPRVWRGQHG